MQATAVNEATGRKMVTPLEAAESLRLELGRRHITADVLEGHNLALVSVWVGVVVWCDGQKFCGAPAGARGR
ncbi:hypothetical protein Misp01_05920 [Microtetraspora sp. NBRC 13810]|nr:hypothetical protein Misp01_05920 [Microtetraspora sp. NBRC 13810]